MYQFMLLLCFTQLFVSHNFTYGSLEAKVQESQDNTQVLSVLYDQCVFNYKKKNQSIFYNNCIHFVPCVCNVM